MNYCNKDNLLKNLYAAKEIGHQYINIGRDIQKEGQRLLDEAEITERVINLPFQCINYETQNMMWGGTVSSGLQNLVQFNFRTPVDNSSGSAIAEIYNCVPALIQEIYTYPIDKQKYATETVTKLCRQVESINTKDETLLILSKYRFTKGYGNNRSPLESFAIGYAAYENPVVDGNPTVTSLIPLRSCIDDIIADLLRRRIRQEQTANKAKIISIGNQLRYESISDDIILFWARQYSELNDILSDAKSAKMDRTEWGKTLQRAMNFIIGFLKILDPDKMKLV